MNNCPGIPYLDATYNYTQITQLNTSYGSMGDQIMFQCQPDQFRDDFEDPVQDNLTITCRVDGTWDTPDPVPQCRLAVQCNYPAEPTTSKTPTYLALMTDPITDFLKVQ